MDLIFFRNFRTKPAFTILLFFGLWEIDNSFAGRELSFMTQKIFGQFVHDSGIGWGDKSDNRMKNTQYQGVEMRTKFDIGNGYWGLTIEHWRFTIMIDFLNTGTTKRNGKPKEK